MPGDSPTSGGRGGGGGVFVYVHVLSVRYDPGGEKKSI